MFYVKAVPPTHIYLFVCLFTFHHIFLEEAEDRSWTLNAIHHSGDLMSLLNDL